MNDQKNQMPFSTKIDVSKFISYVDPKFFGENFKVKHLEFVQKEFAGQLGRETNRNHNPALKGINDLIKILSSEHNSKKDLEILAIRTAKELFPVIKLAGIRITADIDYSISHNNMSLRGTPNFPKEVPDDISDEEYNKIAKQKYLNGLVQGAAIKMNRIQHYQADKLKEINSDLIGLYDDVLKNNELLSSTLNRVELALNAIECNKKKRVMGSNKVTFENGVPRITAKANNFVILVHEIIKGLYTYLTLNAYETEEDYYDTTEYTDSIFSEMDEIAIGKILIDELRDHLFKIGEEKQVAHPAFFEMFIVKLSKVPANEFMTLIKSLNEGHPDDAKFKALIFDTYYELKKFDKTQ